MKKDKIITRKKRMQIIILIVAFLIIFVPIILNYLLPIDIGLSKIYDGTSASLWLAYWGSIVGALIGAVATFIMLYYTILQNEEMNKNAKEQMLNQQRHIDNKEWINKIKDYLVEIYSAFDLNLIYELIFLANSGQSEKVRKIVMQKSNEINRNNQAFLLYCYDGSEKMMEDFTESLYACVNVYMSVLETLLTISEIQRFIKEGKDNAQIRIVEYLKEEQSLALDKIHRYPQKYEFINNILTLKDEQFFDDLHKLVYAFYSSAQEEVKPYDKMIKDFQVVLVKRLEEKYNIKHNG